MATKKLNLNKMMKEWLDENLPKLPIEQVKQLRDNPDMLVEAVIEGLREACEERGVDYTTTPMYQEELKFRKQQAEEQASREKWAHLDTPENNEMFEMAFRSAWQLDMVSSLAHSILYEFDSFTPAKFKVFMDKYVLVDKRGRFPGKKTSEQLIRFNEYYDQNYSEEVFAGLNSKERLLKIACNFALGLNDEEQQFVSRFVDEHDHLPMFWLVAKFFENVDIAAMKVAREYYGICGPRKSLEQLQQEFGLTPQRVLTLQREGLYRGAFSKQSPKSCWDAYRPLFAEPILTMDNIPYEQIKAEEHLVMDADCFMLLVGHCLPWTQVIKSVKIRDLREWTISAPGAEHFLFHKLFWHIRRAQYDKAREKEIVFNLNKICRDKSYWWAYGEDVEPNQEAFPIIITICKTIVREMLGIEPQRNKVIIPARKQRK